MSILTTEENCSREKTNHASAHLLVDRPIDDSLIHSSLCAKRFSNLRLFIHMAYLPDKEPVHRAWNSEESPLACRRKPQRDLRSVLAKDMYTVRRSKCVSCVCVMTWNQAAWVRQHKMAKLPRTSVINNLPCQNFRAGQWTIELSFL